MNGVKNFAMALAVALPLAAAGTTTAAAQCVTVDPVILADVRVDPLDATGAAQVMQPVTMMFRRVGVGNAPITVAYQIVDEDSSVRSRVGVTGGPQLEWRSDDSGRNIGATRNEAYALLRSGSVTLGADDNSQQATLRLFLTNLREDLPAGVYREQYTIRYWCADRDSSIPEEIPGIVTVTVQVPNVLSANVAGASTQGEIDFLDFSTLTRSLSVSVRSTGRFAVTARSVNGSVMLREGAAGTDKADRIPYVVRFGGRALALDTGAGFTNPRAGLAGQQIPLEVVVDDVSSKRAGAYSDTLILTLAPVT
ncbi:MAG: hypothetical protein A2885_10045 [Sphingopyxis sp. RIFCSPHIGHO2_01_FULL_65_24]|nr:MAG: hypothetical protein A2885_10045 [Sphingopyxis sp. RIFCSPHIGHO2_01_FULL_65_24]